MKRVGIVAVVLAVALGACAKTTEGEPAAGEAAETSRMTAPSSRAIPTPEADLNEPGIVATQRTPVPAGATTCAAEPPPPVSATASVADPAAPKITVALPEGWSTSAGDGDVGARIKGPDGISATVTITRTTLDPAGAFKQYADDAMAASSVSTISILPADLCGYSGQKLYGSWSESPQQAIDFGDRIAHVWTSTNDYLVAVHVEAPAATPGFDPMTSPLMDDFAIVIP